MTDPHLSDRASVVRLRAGDEAAFEAFFSDYFPGLFRFALARVGRDEDAAQEVVQAALSRAVTRLSTYRGEAALFTWLCTFCRHEIAAHWRRRGGGREAPLVEDLPEVRAALESLAAGREGGPDDELRRRELARLVQVTLDRVLDPGSRALRTRLDGVDSGRWDAPAAAVKTEYELLGADLACCSFAWGGTSRSARSARSGPPHALTRSREGRLQTRTTSRTIGPGS